MTAATDSQTRRAVSHLNAQDGQSVFETHLNLPGRRQGKVRDVYLVPKSKHEPERVLIVASDRISAFDVVMPTPVPGKGRLLTAISNRWFALIRAAGIIADHLVSTSASDVPGLDPTERAMIEGRMTLARRAEVVPIEFVVRGYLAGSGWVEYQQTQSVCGVRLPPGLRQCERLPEPIFTPATKASVGHDENIDFERACEIAGRGVMERLREVSLAIYALGAKHAEARGIILADTKFEFGYAVDESGATTRELMLIDEALTPDSSRFWPAEEYQPGHDQESFDKQYLRNYLQQLVKTSRWAKQPPGPQLPDDVVHNTLRRYQEAHDRLFPG